MHKGSAGFGVWWLITCRGILETLDDGRLAGSIRADELVRVDCDPVRQVRVRQLSDGGGVGREVWTASDDSVVRRYLY